MRYVIIGANAAGLSAAMRIHKLDKKAVITVLDKGNIVSFGACGIPYYIADEFSNSEQMTARELNDFVKLGIDIRLFHEVISIDTQKKQIETFSQGSRGNIVFDRLLIASGARPFIPNIPGVDSPRVRTMHSKQDALVLKALLPEIENVIIIGGGYIGVEAAEAFSLQGKAVHIIEAGEQLLSRTFDREISIKLAQHLKEKNVNLSFSATVKQIIDHSNAAEVVVEHKSYRADLIVLAAGFQPNTSFVQVGEFNILENGALVINEYCQTSVTDIYAAGDCATVPHLLMDKAYIPLATTANKLGRLAGENMAGQTHAFIKTLGASAIRVFDYEAASIGLTETVAQILNKDYVAVLVQDKNRSEYVPPQSDIWIKLIVDRQSRQILGAQLLGQYSGGAVQRLNTLSVAIYAGITVDQLGMMDFVYAPPFSRPWDVLNIAANVAVKT